MRAEALPWISKSFRVTMAWQAATSIGLAIVAGVVAGSAGFLSAALGGGIGVVGVLVFALFSGPRARGSGGAVRIALRAEAAKVIVIVLLLWLVFAAYRDMVVLAFMSTFMGSVLLSGLGFVVSDDQLNSSKV
jgi:ATP synthase protein I